MLYRRHLDNYRNSLNDSLFNGNWESDLNNQNSAGTFGRQIVCIAEYWLSRKTREKDQAVKTFIDTYHAKSIDSIEPWSVAFVYFVVNEAAKFQKVENKLVNYDTGNGSATSTRDYASSIYPTNINPAIGSIYSRKILGSNANIMGIVAKIDLNSKIFYGIEGNLLIDGENGIGVKIYSFDEIPLLQFYFIHIENEKVADSKLYSYPGYICGTNEIINKEEIPMPILPEIGSGGLLGAKSANLPITPCIIQENGQYYVVYSFLNGKIKKPARGQNIGTVNETWEFLNDAGTWQKLGYNGRDCTLLASAVGSSTTNETAEKKTIPNEAIVKPVIPSTTGQGTFTPDLPGGTIPKTGQPDTGTTTGQGGFIPSVYTIPDCIKLINGQYYFTKQITATVSPTSPANSGLTVKSYSESPMIEANPLFTHVSQPSFLSDGIIGNFAQAFSSGEVLGSGGLQPAVSASGSNDDGYIYPNATMIPARVANQGQYSEKWYAYIDGQWIEIIGCKVKKPTVTQKQPEIVTKPEQPKENLPACISIINGKYFYNENGLQYDARKFTPIGGLLKEEWYVLYLGAWRKLDLSICKPIVPTNEPVKPTNPIDIIIPEQPKVEKPVIVPQPQVIYQQPDIVPQPQVIYQQPQVVPQPQVVYQQQPVAIPQKSDVPDDCDCEVKKLSMPKMVIYDYPKANDCRNEFY